MVIRLWDEDSVYGIKGTSLIGYQTPYRSWPFFGISLGNTILFPRTPSIVHINRFMLLRHSLTISSSIRKAIRVVFRQDVVGHEFHPMRINENLLLFIPYHSRDFLIRSPYQQWDDDVKRKRTRAKPGLSSYRRLLHWESFHSDPSGKSRNAFP